MLKKTLVQAFREVAGRENVFEHEADRAAYAYDAAVLDPVVPALVVRPRDGEAMSGVIRLCHENGVPLTVRGAGTNLSGGTIPDPNGIVVLTQALDRIVEICPDDLYAVVEPGVVTEHFASAVASQGLFYPPDPGSQSVSTLGGNVAENAGGLRGLKYGVTRDYVLGLEFFDASGELIKTGARTVKCVMGYNLAALLVGSEGTLGVIHRIYLKLLPAPRHRKSMMAVFDHVDAASETVAAIIAARIIPATLEFLDQVTLRAVEAFSGVGLPVDAAAMLLIETDGHPAQVEEEAMQIEALCRKYGARRVQVARSEDERNRVWEARRSALSALAKLKPTLVLEDATVPRSRIPQMVRALGDIARTYELTIGTFGHAGDGNLHPTILTDRRNRDEWRRVEQAVEAIFDRALDLGGTLSGEHGIGLAKVAFMERETTRPTLVYSRRIKRALDPGNILNPGKVVGEA